jgi:abnormal spindle-like microcephaly-associated protein
MLQVSSVAYASALEGSRQNKAAIVIQQRLRGHQTRSAVFVYLQARIIQTKWRQFVPYRAYRQYRAALRVQTLWRMKTLSSVYTQFIAALRIQLSWRCTRDRSAFIRYRGATRIQTIWRCKRKFHAYKHYRAAERIQKTWRMASAHASYRDYIAARRIQSAWRGYFARIVFLTWQAETLAATMIQSSWRGFVCYTDYLISMEDIIAAQSVARWYLARNELSNLRREKEENLAAVEIQRCFRGSQSRSGVAELLESIELERTRQVVLAYTSAVQIQKMIRGAMTRFRLTAEDDAAIKIQTAYRGKRVREFYAWYQASVIIQTCWRSKCVRADYRNYIAARRIQAAWRGEHTRTMLDICRAEELAAVMIQSAWRGFLCYTDYLFTVGDIVMAQKIARGWFAREKAAVLRGEKAAIVIQRSFRGFVDRSIVSELRVTAVRERSAVAIQSIWRGHYHKQHFWYCLGCAMLIQKVTRGTLTRNQIRKEHAAATKIQSATRGMKVQSNYRNDQFTMMLSSSATMEIKSQDSVEIIEQWWLNVRARREEAAITLQGWARRQIFARKLDNYATQIWCATMIQRWWGRMLFSRELEEFVIALRELEAAEEAERSLQEAAARMARWWRRCCARIERREIIRANNQAANTIQGFFLMVKAMVDREIRAEKKRRMERRKIKQIHHTPENEDDLLESIWASAIEKTDVDPPKSSSRSRRPPGVPRSPRVGNDGASVTSERSRGGRRRLKGELHLNTTDYDERSVNSQRTARSLSRVPPPRLTTYSSNDFKDDVSLEEAWIDVEINHLKEKRRSSKSSSSKRPSKRQTHV